MRILLALVALTVLVSGCAAPSEGSPPRGASSSSPNPPPEDLVVQIHRDAGSPAETYHLVCGATVSGNHPAGVAACAHLNTLAHPFAPLPAGVMCSQIYGGPQTAHVTGRWKGAAVDVRLSRVDGCRVEQWNSLGPLLPGPVGAAPPS